MSLESPSVLYRGAASIILVAAQLCRSAHREGSAETEGELKGSATIDLIYHASPASLTPCGFHGFIAGHVHPLRKQYQHPVAPPAAQVSRRCRTRHHHGARHRPCPERFAEARERPLA